MTNYLEQFESAIRDYLSLKSDFAVMLQGSWGSGKTYYLKNRLIPMLEAWAKGKKEPVPKHFLHVSLHGLAKQEEIDQRIFYALAPFFDRAQIKRCAGIASAVAAAMSFGGVKLSFNDWINYRLILAPRLKETFVAFDDIERTQIEPISALRYVSELVENAGLKALIVCNETELLRISEPEAPKSTIEENPSNSPLPTIPMFSYYSTKEKLVRYCFEFRTDILSFVDSISVQEQYNELAREVLKKNICPVLLASKEDFVFNLRIFHYAFQAFSKIVASLFMQQNASHILLRDLFLRIFAWCDFFQNKDVKSEFEKYYRENQKDHIERELSRLYFLAERYGKPFNINPELPDALKAYVEKGYFSKEDIKREVFGDDLSLEDEYFYRLKEWWASDDKRLKSLLSQSSEILLNSKFSFSQLISLGRFLIKMISDNVYVEIGENAIELVLKKFKEKVEGSNELLNWFEIFEKNLVFEDQNSKPEELKRKNVFISSCKEAVEVRNKALERELIKNLWTQVSTNPESFKEQAYLINKSEKAKLFFEIGRNFDLLFAIKDLNNVELREIFFAIEHVLKAAEKNELVFQEDDFKGFFKRNTNEIGVKEFWLKKIETSLRNKQ